MLWEKIFKKDPPPPKEAPTEEEQALKRAKRRIYSQAAVVVLVISVTVILMFAATTAWYTNVVKTSELSFQAAKWGFDGDVLLDDNSAITAMPGQSGAIPLTIINNGDSPVMASVNVSKGDGMDPRLRPRVFFYVDAARSSANEVTDRVYLTNSGGYSYLLLGGDTLTLTEELHNDALIKWEWVLDLVGYYYRASDSSGTVAEVIRPVVYDPELATYDANGLLQTVDGVKTTGEFLNELTRSDGYPGAIPATVSTDTQKFPVDQTNGIWIYLFSRNEIAYNDQVDNELGANGTSFNARITISAQTDLVTPTEVDSKDELATAFSDPQTDYVKLTDTVDLGSQQLRLSGEGNRLVLDLSGNSLHSDVDGMFQVENGASLTVLNGAVRGNAETNGVDEQIMANVQNGDLVLSGVTTDKVGIAVMVNDSYGVRDSKVRIRGCTLKTTDRTVVPFGNGSWSGQKTQVYIENSTLESGYVAIMGNGSVLTNSGGLDRWGTEVYVDNCTVTGYYAAVFQPQQQSAITIVNSELSGNTGVVLKGGRAILRDSRVTGTGAVNLEAPAFSGSGFSDTGDGVYIETNYDWQKTLTVSGSSFVKGASGSEAIRVYKTSDENYSVALEGGYYSTNVAAFAAQGRHCVSSSEDGYPYKIE